MAKLAPYFKQMFFDLNGKPLAGGKVWTYTAGTTTPRASFTDESGLVPNTNPVILDASGEASIWLGNGFYKFVVTDANDVWQRTIDRVSTGTGGEIPASDIATDVFSGDGTQTVFTLSADPLSQLNTFVFIHGIYQNKSTYTVDGTTLTFLEAPPAGTANIEVMRGTALAVGNIPDNSITTPKLVNAVITTPKIINAAVTTEKLADGAVTQNKRVALPYAISESSGEWTNSSNLVHPVTNLTVTIVTTGRPVFVGLIDDGNGMNAGVYSTTTGDSTTSVFYFKRGIDIIGGKTLEMTSTGSGATVTKIKLPGSSFNTVDFPTAGTQTYTFDGGKFGTGTTAGADYVKLIAYEL